MFLFACLLGCILFICLLGCILFICLFGCILFTCLLSCILFTCLHIGLYLVRMFAYWFVSCSHVRILVCILFACSHIGLYLVRMFTYWFVSCLLLVRIPSSVRIFFSHKIQIKKFFYLRIQVCCANGGCVFSTRKCEAPEVNPNSDLENFLISKTLRNGQSGVT